MVLLTHNIISKHIIKPSVPTPNRFKIHKLSYLDQLVIPCYVSPILFYQNGELESNIKISELLKQSLSKVLVTFHPFSGVIKENSFVDCNDTGVEFVETQVHTHLAQFIQESKFEDLQKLVPIDGLSHSDNRILSVQVNFFDCGGIAIGICLSHKVADYASTMVFMNAWASSTCHGELTQGIQPFFDLALHFPPRDFIPNYNFDLQDTDNIKTKRFVFDREKLERLQQQTSCENLKHPTKVEALTAFIWQQFNEATKVISDKHKKKKKKAIVVYHIMNLRSRSIPPIPDQTIGNCISTFSASTSDTTDISDFVSKLRMAKNSLDNNYIQQVIKGGEYSGFFNKENGLFDKDTENLLFTSVWRYPVYDINFGWGKPIWTTVKFTVAKNTIYFFSTPSQDGIEAWVSMSEDVLQMLEIGYNKFFK